MDLKKILSVPSRFIGLNRLVKLAGQPLILPFYHTVSDIDLPHINHLYPVITTQKFIQDLDFFKTHFNALTYKAIVESVQGKKEIKEKAFFLTFDDGLREFYDVIAPILIQKGIPAMCFINTAFLDNKDLFFRFKASLLIEKILRKPLTGGQQKAMEDLFVQYKLVYHSAKDVLKVSHQNKELLNAAAALVEVSYTEFLVEQKPYLTSHQVHELIQKGFQIGTHSVSHPYYAAIPEAEQVQQTLESLRFLQEHFSIEERAFAFPYTDFGVQKSFFDTIQDQIELSFGTAKFKIDSIPTNLQRIPMERNTKAKDIIKEEYFLYLLKKGIGKHRIERS